MLNLQLLQKFMEIILVDISKDDQARIAKARGKHLGTSIISQIIEK